ncbi:hypothetical protein PsYK624_055980 [Phanerochaete sordida]|uniref:Uncharacterized protein n=1 Tax=Phanerochaete sordida TaxID=48140 RepID=A0A9P3G5C6_9APHY|nr:hypothetical protein PsYK624_055980 [Phanerochaete sordida]
MSKRPREHGADALPPPKKNPARRTKQNEVIFLDGIKLIATKSSTGEYWLCPRSGCTQQFSQREGGFKDLEKHAQSGACIPAEGFIVVPGHVEGTSLLRTFKPRSQGPTSAFRSHVQFWSRGSQDRPSGSSGGATAQTGEGGQGGGIDGTQSATGVEVSDSSANVASTSQPVLHGTPLGSVTEVQSSSDPSLSREFRSLSVADEAALPTRPQTLADVTQAIARRPTSPPQVQRPVLPTRTPTADAPRAPGASARSPSVAQLQYPLTPASMCDGSARGDSPDSDIEELAPEVARTIAWAKPAARASSYSRQSLSYLSPPPRPAPPRVSAEAEPPAPVLPVSGASRPATDASEQPAPPAPVPPLPELPAPERPSVMTALPKEPAPPVPPISAPPVLPAPASLDPAPPALPPPAQLALPAPAPPVVPVPVPPAAPAPAALPDALRAAPLTRAVKAFLATLHVLPGVDLPAVGAWIEETGCTSDEALDTLASMREAAFKEDFDAPLRREFGVRGHMVTQVVREGLALRSQQRGLAM